MKVAGKLAKKGAYAAGKAAYKHPGIVNQAIDAGAGALGTAAGGAVTAATGGNAAVGGVAGMAVGTAASHAAIAGKDRLLQHYFGAQHNAGSSHSGKNYAVKRKAAVRYNIPSGNPDARSERTIRTSPAGSGFAKGIRSAARNRNISHVLSASHPTGAKI